MERTLAFLSADPLSLHQARASLAEPAAIAVSIACSSPNRWISTSTNPSSPLALAS